MLFQFDTPDISDNSDGDSDGDFDAESGEESEDSFQMPKTKIKISMPKMRSKARGEEVNARALWDLCLI